MWRKLLELVAPFQVIARELTAIRELGEAYLADKHNIRRITESPSESDTEVSYGIEKGKRTPNQFPETPEEAADVLENDY